MTKQLPDNFYEQIKLRLHKRIGQEVRLARRVLDLGCGSCDLVRYLASAYDQEVTGAADGSADAVVSMWALHEMEKPRAILGEARRVLRPGGEIFVIDFPRDSLALRLWNEDYYRPDEVKTLLQETGFEKIQVHLIEQGQVMWARGYRPPAC